MTDQETKYVDGFVLVIPKANVEAYKKMANDGVNAWMKHGALSYRECMLDDSQPAMEAGTRPLTFLALTKAGPDDTVWFSYIEFRSKAHRDEVNAKVMQEMQQMEYEGTEMPFDINQMAYGGFQVIISGPEAV